jgi:hypothetical protein
MRAHKIVLAATLALGACGDPMSGPGGRDNLFEVWKQKGLKPTGFKAAKVDVGKDCHAGTVDGVDVLVCQYATPEEAKAAEPKGYEWVGEATGTTVIAGKVLVSAADKRKADPSGRTIDKLMKLSK